MVKLSPEIIFALGNFKTLLCLFLPLNNKLECLPLTKITTQLSTIFLWVGSEMRPLRAPLGLN
jgi:hypothetical protein